MATKGLLRKLLPMVPSGELKELDAEAFLQAFEDWDPEKQALPYVEGFNAWKGEKLKGCITTYLRRKKRSFQEEAGGDVSLIPVSPGRNPLKMAFNRQVKGIVASALDSLNPQVKALVRAHYWGDKPLAPQQHKALYEALAALRSLLCARGYKAEDLIWDCDGSPKKTAQADLLFAA